MVEGTGRGRSVYAREVVWVSPRKQEEALEGSRNDDISPVSRISDSTGSLGTRVEEGKRQGEASESLSQWMALASERWNGGWR